MLLVVVVRGYGQVEVEEVDVHFGEFVAAHSGYVYVAHESDVIQHLLVVFGGPLHADHALLSGFLLLFVHCLASVMHNMCDFPLHNQYLKLLVVNSLDSHSYYFSFSSFSYFVHFYFYFFFYYHLLCIGICPCYGYC